MDGFYSGGTDKIIKGQKDVSQLWAHSQAFTMFLGKITFQTKSIKTVWHPGMCSQRRVQHLETQCIIKMQKQPLQRCEHCCNYPALSSLKKEFNTIIIFTILHAKNQNKIRVFRSDTNSPVSSPNWPSGIRAY